MPTAKDDVITDDNDLVDEAESCIGDLEDLKSFIESKDMNSALSMAEAVQETINRIHTYLKGAST